MRTTIRLALTALAAALTLNAAIGTASAARLSISSQALTLTWAALNFSGTGLNITCAVSHEGSFHSRTITKTVGSLIGHIRGGRITHPCTGGEAWILNGTERAGNTYPWSIHYQSFEGSLPNITGIRVALIEAAYLIQNGLLLCLFQATVTNPAYGILTRNTTTGAITGLRLDESVAILRAPAVLNSAMCPNSVRLSGTATTNALTVTLI
jgi:hypothetical protein